MRMKFLLTVACLLAFTLCSFAQTKIWENEVSLYDYDCTSDVQGGQKKKNKEYLTFVRTNSERKTVSLVFLKSSFSPYIHHRKSSSGDEFVLILDDVTNGGNWSPSVLGQAKNHVVLIMRKSDFVTRSNDKEDSTGNLHIECVLKEKGETGKGNKLVVGKNSYSPVQEKHFVTEGVEKSFSLYSYTLDIKELKEIINANTIEIAQYTLNVSGEHKSKLQKFYKLYLFLSDKTE